MKEEFKPTKEMMEAANNLVAARNHFSKMEPTILEIKKRILDIHDFECDDEFLEELGKKYVREPEYDYMITEKMAEQYFALLHEEYKKAKLQAEPGYCPLSIAKQNIMKAEAELIDSMQPITKVSSKSVVAINSRKKLVDMSFGLISDFMS